MKNVDWDSAFFVLGLFGMILGIVLFIDEASWLNLAIIVVNGFAAWLNFRAIQRKEVSR